MCEQAAGRRRFMGPRPDPSKARELVLGDIVAVDDGSQVLPCDGVVIQGSLVVNESMLTGASVPRPVGR